MGPCSGVHIRHARITNPPYKAPISVQHIKASSRLASNMNTRLSFFSLRPYSAVPASLNIMTTRTLPECWGHRGASAYLPENTLASFEAAMKDGAEGIETDIHISRDGVLVMFHDPYLSRTTDMKGAINELEWHGPNGMNKARTIKEPKQSIPTLLETLSLLMKENNKHVQLNIDCKVNNEPDRLFSAVHSCLSTFPDWQTTLAPRILLGLWHPCFIEPAIKHVGYLRRAFIGRSPWTAKEYFWPHVEVFSLEFGALCSYEGQVFISECAAAGKKVLVWTVNKEEEMMEAVRWNVHAILTDTTATWLSLREKLKVDYQTAASQLPRSFLWTSLRFYTGVQLLFWRLEKTRLESLRGPFMRVSPLLSS